MFEKYVNIEDGRKSLYCNDQRVGVSVRRERDRATSKSGCEKDAAAWVDIYGWWSDGLSSYAVALTIRLRCRASFRYRDIKNACLPNLRESLLFSISNSNFELFSIAAREFRNFRRSLLLLSSSKQIYEISITT